MIQNIFCREMFDILTKYLSKLFVLEVSQMSFSKSYLGRNFSNTQNGQICPHTRKCKIHFSFWSTLYLYLWGQHAKVIQDFFQLFFVVWVPSETFSECLWRYATYKTAFLLNVVFTILIQNETRVRIENFNDSISFISTGRFSHFQNPDSFKVLKEPTISQMKALILSFFELEGEQCGIIILACYYRGTRLT